MPARTCVAVKELPFGALVSTPSISWFKLMQAGRDRGHGPPVRRRSGNKVAGTVWRMDLIMECGPSLVCTRVCEL